LREAPAPPESTCPCARGRGISPFFRAGRRLLCFLALTAASGGFAADSGAPRMVLSLPTCDFGKVGHGQRLTKECVIANQGTATLRISRIWKSCDCTTLALNGKTLRREEPATLELPPSAVAKLSITLSTGRIMGVLHKYVEITSNDPERPAVKINVVAHVHDDVKALPWTLPPFTAVVGGKPATQALRLLWIERPATDPPLSNLKADRPNVAARAVPLNADELAAALKDLRENNPSSAVRSLPAGYRIEITITPPATDGFLSASLTALVNGRPWEFSVNGTVFAGIVVEPQCFQFGEIRDPATAEQTITLRSADDTSFAITDIVSDPDYLAFSVDSDPDGKTHRVTARLSAVDDRKPFFARVTIRTSHPKKPTLQASCLGIWPVNRKK
jgi:hypothetical protein